jgi:hypothetical protein
MEGNAVRVKIASMTIGMTGSASRCDIRRFPAGLVMAVFVIVSGLLTRNREKFDSS